MYYNKLPAIFGNGSVTWGPPFYYKFKIYNLATIEHAPLFFFKAYVIENDANFCWSAPSWPSQKKILLYT